MPTETYTLNYRRTSDEKNKRNRYIFHSDHKNIESLWKTAEGLLKLFKTIQIVKNNK